MWLDGGAAADGHARFGISEPHHDRYLNFVEKILPMRLPNLFATQRGRLFGFFLLYTTEGVPLGFAATAVATLLRRQGVGPAEIGAFVASFYLPWAFKWAFGPIVDVLGSERLGHRRGWILITQLVMVLTLAATFFLELPAQLAAFTAILIVHNVFAATQDVAIDALAVNLLDQGERATATGMMFAGASIGQMVGGSGALFVASAFGFQASVLFVAAAVFAVTIFVVLPMREAARRAIAPRGSNALGHIGKELRQFGQTAFRSFMGSQGAFVGLFLALLPPGAMCLGLALQSNLAVELGLDDDQIAWLAVATTLVTALGSLLGGRWADRLDRRRALLIYIVLMTIPVLGLAAVLQGAGWILPVTPDAASKIEVPQHLVIALWLSTLVYGFFNGMMYSASTAIYMDVTNPAVAATQFTAYMALFNLAIANTATWQGISIEGLGYPITMLLDCAIGLVYLVFLPLLRAPSVDNTATRLDSRATARARALCTGLLLVLVACLIGRGLVDAGSALESLLRLFSNLGSVGAALTLFAAASLLGVRIPRCARGALVSAWLLLASLVLSFVQTQLPQQQPALWLSGIQTLSWLAPMLAVVLLAILARDTWSELNAVESANSETHLMAHVDTRDDVNHVGR